MAVVLSELHEERVRDFPETHGGVNTITVTLRDGARLHRSRGGVGRRSDQSAGLRRDPFHCQRHRRGRRRLTAQLIFTRALAAPRVDVARESKIVGAEGTEDGIPPYFGDGIAPRTVMTMNYRSPPWPVARLLGCWIATGQSLPVQIRQCRLLDAHTWPLFALPELPLRA